MGYFLAYSHIYRDMKGERVAEEWTDLAKVVKIRQNLKKLEDGKEQ